MEGGGPGSCSSKQSREGFGHTMRSLESSWGSVPSKPMSPELENLNLDAN